MSEKTNRNGVAGEGFLRRWARLKSAPAAGHEGAPDGARADDRDEKRDDKRDDKRADVRYEDRYEDRPEAPATATQAPAASPHAPARPAPTLEDVARLTPQSDYSAFVASGVDQEVRRTALKKLFADPGFAVMDGLDIYIADYNQVAPLSEAMLAALRHAPQALEDLLGPDDEERAGADGADGTAEVGPQTPPQGTP